MGSPEHLRVLDPQARKFVDVEEPPIVDVARCDPPIRQAIRLGFQDPQRSEALQVSEHAIDESKRAIDGLPDDLGRRYDAGKARLQALAFVQQDHAPVEARVLAHGAQPLAQGEQFADLLGVPFLESGQGPASTIG